MGDAADDLERALECGQDEWDEAEAEDRAAKSVRQGRKGAMQRRGNSRRQEYVEVGEVEVVRETPRALLVRFEGGRERWIPISQTPQGFEWEIGKTVMLEVSEWLTETEDWDVDAKKDDDVSLPEAVCLGESAKALKVRVGSERDPVWIPRGHVREASAVKGDGDRGVLVVSHWIAAQKGWVEGAEPEGPSVRDDIGRRGDGGGQRQVGFDDHFPERGDPDDDIPFIRYWPA